MKKLLFLILSITILSCTSDDDANHKCIDTDTLNVRYDSQDNLVKINDGNWETSWNLDTWEGLHPTIAIRHGYNESEIRISSDVYFDLTAVVINDVLTYSEQREDGDWYCSFPNMSEYLNDTDLFYLTITATKYVE